MKNIWKSLFVAALFVSCSESMTEETVAPEVNNGKAIKFEVANNGGRAAFFQGGHGVAFEEGDVIGLRLLTGGVSSEDHQAVEDKTMGGTYADSDAYLADNVQRGNYSLKDGVWTLYSPETAKWQALHWIDNTQNEICAFSLPMASLPDSKQANGPDNRYPHNINLAVLSATQVQAAANDHSHIGNYMIMSSDPQMFGKNEQPEVVNIQFQNVLSIVEVTLKSAETKSLMNLTMTSKTTPLAFTKGSLNATKKVSTGVSPFVIDEGMGVNEVKLTLTEAAEVTAEGAKFYFVVLPGVHAANDITLTATCTDGSFAEVAMGAIEFKTNKVYRPTVTLAAADFKQPELPAEIELHFDFSMVPTEDDGTVWGTATTINNAKKAANLYQAPKTYAMQPYLGLEFVFSCTVTSITDAANNFGICYVTGKNYLAVIPGNTGQTTQTIGLPVREGYKLVSVTGYCAPKAQDKTGTYVAITSDAGGVKVAQGTMNTSGSHKYAEVVTDDSTVVSEFEGMTNEKVIMITAGQETPWTFTIPTAQKNTRYYLSASGPYLCIKHLYLTYERVDE